MSARISRTPFLVECIFSAAILLGIAYHMYFLLTEGYLAAPFFYETFDTWMDWFNTAFWARESGTYDVWRSIYPPLTFVFLRLVGIDSCYTGPVEARECDWVGVAVMHGLFVLNAVLIAMTFIKLDRRTALPRSIAVAAGMPMLFALERGNVILAAFACLILALGPLLRSTKLRWLLIGLAVNFKVYLVSVVIAQLLRRRWLWTEGALLSIVAVYALSYLMFGAGSPIEILQNILVFAESYQSGQLLNIWYPSTYQPALNLLSGMNFPIGAFIGSRLTDLGIVVLTLITRTGQVAIVLAAIATWLRPEVVPPHRVALIGIAMALISTEASGYTQITLVLFVMMERWRGIARPVAIISAYILCLPWDWPLIVVPPIVNNSFLAGHMVEAHYDVGIGVFLRPGLTVVIAVALSMATIRDVWAVVREQGWRLPPGGSRACEKH